MDNVFDTILDKLNEPKWKGRTSPSQAINWGDFKQLINELKRDEDKLAETRAIAYRQLHRL